jgi:hypothetical protein
LFPSLRMYVPTKCYRPHSKTSVYSSESSRFDPGAGWYLHLRRNRFLPDPFQLTIYRRLVIRYSSFASGFTVPCSNPCGSKGFFSPHPFRPALRPTHSPIESVLGLFPVGKGSRSVAYITYPYPAPTLRMSRVIPLYFPFMYLWLIIWELHHLPSWRRIVRVTDSVRFASRCSYLWHRSGFLLRYIERVLSPAVLRGLL